MLAFYSLFDDIRQTILAIFSSKAEVTVTQKQYATLCDPKMCSQVNLGIPMSNNIKVMPGTHFF